MKTCEYPAGGSYGSGRSPWAGKDQFISRLPDFHLLSWPVKQRTRPLCLPIRSAWLPWVELYQFRGFQLWFHVRGSVWDSSSQAWFFNAGKSTVELMKWTSPNTPKQIQPQGKTGLLESSMDDPDFRVRVEKRCETDNGVSKALSGLTFFPRDFMMLHWVSPPWPLRSVSNKQLVRWSDTEGLPSKRNLITVAYSSCHIMQANEFLLVENIFNNLTRAF